MKIVRHLLSFTWLFITLAFLLGLIYFRADLFPESINKPIDTGMTAIEEATGIKIPQYKDKSKHSVAIDSTTTDKPAARNIENVYPEYAEDVSPPEPVEVESTYETAATSEEVSSDKADDMAAVVEIVKETISEKVDEMIEAVEQGDEQPDEAQVAIVQAEPVPESMISKPAEEITPEVPQQQAETPVKEIVIDAKQLLHKARSLYWEGKLDAAEKAYMDLSEQESLDPNVFGELGNIYYAQGKWKQAGDAYYEAAILLLDLKQMAQVNYLLRVIQGLDAEAAEKLKKKISG